jgi:hypothetical protein
MKKIVLIFLVLILVSNCNSRKHSVPLSCNANFFQFEKYFGIKEIDSIYLLRCHNAGGGCRIRTNASDYLALDKNKDTIIIFDICGDNNFEINKQYKLYNIPLDSIYKNEFILISCGTDLTKYPIYFGTLK